MMRKALIPCLLLLVNISAAVAELGVTVAGTVGPACHARSLAAGFLDDRTAAERPESLDPGLVSTGVVRGFEGGGSER